MIASDQQFGRRRASRAVGQIKNEIATGRVARYRGPEGLVGVWPESLSGGTPVARYLAQLVRVPGFGLSVGAGGDHGLPPGLLH